VFDQSWAEAYYSYGLEYYPKLQSCVPFTPVTGQRILLRSTPYRDQVFDALVKGLKSLTAKVSELEFFFASFGLVVICLNAQGKSYSVYVLLLINSTYQLLYFIWHCDIL